MLINSKDTTWGMPVADMQQVFQNLGFQRIWNHPYSFIDYSGLHDGSSEFWWHSQGAFISFVLEQHEDGLDCINPELLFAIQLKSIPGNFTETLLGDSLIDREALLHLLRIDLRKSGFMLWNWCEAANIRVVHPINAKPQTNRDIFAPVDPDLKYEAECLRLESEQMIAQACGEHTRLRCSDSKLFDQLIAYRQLARMESEDQAAYDIYRAYFGQYIKSYMEGLSFDISWKYSNGVPYQLIQEILGKVPEASGITAEIYTQANAYISEQQRTQVNNVAVPKKKHIWQRGR